MMEASSLLVLSELGKDDDNELVLKKKTIHYAAATCSSSTASTAEYKKAIVELRGGRDDEDWEGVAAAVDLPKNGATFEKQSTTIATKKDHKNSTSSSKKED